MMRIYVDFNTEAMDAKRRVHINTDINPQLVPELKAGADVIIYDETLEVHGRLEFDAEAKCWLVAPDWSTRRDLPFEWKR
jgi:hypothetical protein